jgi:hypothetical protein
VFTDDAGTDWVLNGGAFSLAATLAIGNTTGGTDIEITALDSIIGEDASSGGGIPITAGSATVDGNPGGDVTIMGGTTTAASTGDGGAVLIQGRTPASNSGTGGAVTIAAGDGGTGGGNSNGGAVTITGGDAQLSGQGGPVAITAGLALGTELTGATIDITGGENQTSSGTGGFVTALGGTGERAGGDVILKGGTKNTSGVGFTSGNILIEAGNINGTSGFDFGSITIQVPDPATPSTDNILGGSITIKAGATGIRNADGGDVSITAGDTYGFNTRVGGSILLTAGDDNNGNASSDGGLIVMTPGTSVTGEDGRVQILGTGTLEILERGAVTATPAAGRGYVWLRSDTPNSLMFTDDGGTDYVIGGSAVPSDTLQLAYEAGNTIVMDATNGDFDVSGTEAISLDAAAASNFTVAAANLTLSTTTSGTIALTSAGILDLDSGTASALTVNSGAGSGSAGGAISLTSGAGDGANDGGTINVTSGDSGAGATGNGGTVTITAGDALSTNGDGGDIILNPGALSGGGSDGEVTINGKLNVTGGIDPTYLGLNEQASFPTSAVAGIGYLWVRNDAPTTLVYTDDTGSDFPLAGASFSRRGGTALVAGDFALSAGWGSTASVSAITGTDSRFLIEVTSAGTGQAVNPTITLTYADGAWPSAPFPQITDNGSVDIVGAYIAPVFELTTRTTTQAVWTLRSSGAGALYTPVAGDIFKMVVVVVA